MPDPVIGSASRQCRLTAPLGVGLDRSGPAATMRNREQGTSLFSSRTQEAVGVVEGLMAIS